jgi:hypothetical protein
MISQQEAASALYGAFRLARLDLSGLNYFDRSETGLRRSFNAAVIGYPLFLVLLAIESGIGTEEVPAPVRLVLVHTIRYVASWAATPLIMLPIARFLGRAHLWSDFVIVYNWAQIVEFVFLFAVICIVGSGLLPSSLSTGLLGAAEIAVLLYEWLIARVTLSTTGLAATMVVLANFVLGAVLVRIATDLQ